METPNTIYLVPDREDPEYIAWQGDQPASHDEGIEYVKKDIVSDLLEACKEALGLTDLCQPSKALQNISNKILDAIQKAEGSKQLSQGGWDEKKHRQTRGY